jgi:hypothetical protein
MKLPSLSFAFVILSAAATAVGRSVAASRTSAYDNLHRMGASSGASPKVTPFRRKQRPSLPASTNLSQMTWANLLSRAVQHSRPGSQLTRDFCSSWAGFMRSVHIERLGTRAMLRRWAGRVAPVRRAPTRSRRALPPRVSRARHAVARAVRASVTHRLRNQAAVSWPPGR